MALSDRGTSPPKSLENRRRVSAQAAGPDKVCIITISSSGVSPQDQLQPCSAADCVKRNRKSAIPSALPLQVLECVVERGEVLESPLGSRVLVPNFANILRRLVVRKHAELLALKVAPKTLDVPDNADCVQTRA